MLRFIVLALPLLILLLALFGFTVEVLDLEPRDGAVVKLAMLEPPMVPEPLVLGAWLVEACGLVALFLMTQGRCGRWWLDGLVAGWLGWIFRGPLLVITIVVAVRQPQEPWWTLAFGWWVLYSVCGLSLGWLAKHTELDDAIEDEAAEDKAQGTDESMGIIEPIVPDTQLADEQESEPDELLTEPTDSTDSQQAPVEDLNSEDQGSAKPSTDKPDSFSGES